MRKNKLAAFCVLVLLAGSGCNGSLNSVLSPVDSDLTKQGNITHSERVLWGIWDISINPVTREVEIIPLRTADFTANVTIFLQPPASPTHHLKINILPTSNWQAGYLEIDVTLNHPFPGMQFYNGFDVRGILFSNGSVALNHDPSAIRAGANETHMLNPDGWTRWWNPNEFTTFETIFGYTHGKLGPKFLPTSTINPYKYFADDLSKNAELSELDTNSRGFFTTIKGANTRLYKIQFAKVGGVPVFKFQYAVDASWARPEDTYKPDYPKEVFPLEANMAEPWLVKVKDAGSTAYYVSPSDKGGELVLDIEVFDWQAAANPGGVVAELSGLWLEGPVLPGVYNVLANASVVPGSSDISSIFKVTISNLNLTKSGTENLFVIAESASPATYKPQVPNGDKFAYPDKPLSSYFTFDVTISDEGEPTEDPAIVKSLCPMWGLPGKYVSDIRLEGGNIVSGASVKIVHSDGKTINGQNITYINENSMEFDLDLTGASIGYYTVKVINPSAPAGELVNGFDVLDPDNLATWYTAQGDRAQTGMVGLYGPCKIHMGPTWTHNWQPNPYGNPLSIFLNDDTCFLSNTGDGGPLPAGAVHLPTKTTLWIQQFHDDMQNWLNLKGINEDGSVALTYESKYSRIIGLNGSNGSMMWEITGVDVRVDSYITVDLNGNFIVPVQNNGYISVEPMTGKINWNSFTGDMWYSTPAVGANGRIYAYDGDQTSGRLMALDPANGNVIWYSENIGEARGNGVTVHPNGTIIFPTVPGLRCFQDNGNSVSILWTVPYECPFYSSVGIAPDGYIIFISWDGYLHKIDPSNGQAIKSTALKGNWTPSNRPAIGKDGLIYIRTRDYNGDKGYVSCYNPDLTLKWEWYHGAWFWGVGMPSDLAIGQGGWLYSSSRPKGLMAWSD